MNGKHPYSPQQPEQGRKRTCLENTQIPQAPSFSSTNDIDMAAEDQGDTDDGHASVGVLDGSHAIDTSPPSAAHYERLEEESGHYGSSGLNPESSPSTSIAALIEYEPVNDQDGAPAEKASTIIRDRALGTLLTDWPATAGGLTADICDLKALKQIMTSNQLNQDHKAMWVSLVQTIVYEPDRNSVLDFLQNTLSGDAALPSSLEDRPAVPRQDVTLREWAVTGSIKIYGDQKERWSAAHFVDPALWVGGPDAGIQAARAMKIFGVWNPSGSFSPVFAIRSIGDCLGYQDILRSIWPDKNDDQRLIAWSNRDKSTAEQKFDDFGEAHSYLLGQCIGDDPRQFPHLARNPAQAGNVNSRIISRAYFDSTIAPILREHFDTNVDLELAYEAAVASQGGRLDRNPKRHRKPVTEFGLAIPRGDNYGNQGQGRNKLQFDGKFQYDDGEDDSEPELARDEKPIKEDPDAAESIAPGYQEVTQKLTYWSQEEADKCIAMVREVIGKGGDFKSLQAFWAEVHRRLGYSQRTVNALKVKWIQQWSSVGENEDIADYFKSNFNVKSDGGNKSNKARQNNNSPDEAEGDANSHGAASGTPHHEIDEGATDGQVLEHDLIGELYTPSRSQARTEQGSGAIRNTRSKSDPEAREKVITNGLYETSCDFASEVIAQFLQRGNPSLRRHWNEVSEHRLRNNMKTAGPLNVLPFPLVGLPDRSQMAQSSRRPHKVIGDIAVEIQEKNFEDDIRKFERFAESLPGRTVAHRAE